MRVSVGDRGWHKVKPGSMHSRVGETRTGCGGGFVKVQRVQGAFVRTWRAREGLTDFQQESL